MTEPADAMATIRQLRAQLALSREAGDDVVRASNTLMLLLVGDLPLTKLSLEAAIKRTLNARNDWDNAMPKEPIT